MISWHLVRLKPQKCSPQEIMITILGLKRIFSYELFKTETIERVIEYKKRMEKHY